MSQPLSLPQLTFECDRGQATVDGETYLLIDIKTQLLPDNTVSITAANMPFSLSTVERVDVAFTTSSGWAVVAPKCWITKLRFQSDSTASNTTLTLETDSLTARRGVVDPNDRATLYKLLADMPSGDYEPVIFNNPVLKGLTLITASQDQVSKAVGYFVVEDTLRSIIGNWNQIFDEIYWLLSLASANHISFPVTYIQGEKGVEIQIEKTVDAYGGNRTTPVPLSQPRAITAFLDSTIDQYRRLLNQFELNRLIGYYIEMRAAAATEIEYLIGSVFMEALKYLYATSVKHYTYKKHQFYTDRACKNRYTFENAINDIYSDYGITQGLSASKVVKHRNEVIHEGRFTSSFPDVLDTLVDLETTIEHLLLKMLDYDGPYRDRRRRKNKRFDSFKDVVV